MKVTGRFLITYIAKVKWDSLKPCSVSSTEIQMYEPGFHWKVDKN